MLEGNSAEIQAVMRTRGVSRMVAQWADTSNDTNVDSLFLQDVASRMFGLEAGADWKINEGMLLKLAQRRSSPLYNEVYETFLTAMYEDTQAWLAQRGVRQVEVYRGWKWPTSSSVPDWAKAATSGPEESIRSVALRPLSSFSLDRSAALYFAGGGNSVMTSATVNASQILSIPRTGIGCLAEQEVVVIADRLDMMVMHGVVETW